MGRQKKIYVTFKVGTPKYGQYEVIADTFKNVARMNIPDVDEVLYEAQFKKKIQMKIHYEQDN
jgi:hypothetical protein